ncbi:MAG: phospholipase C [Acidimicrobiales bacterium]
MQYTRREFLAGAVGTAGAVALGRSARLGAAGRQLIEAAARVKPAGKHLSSIKHVVFLMHENRSFDHYYGAMGGVNGFNAKSSAFQQAWPGGTDSTLLPFHLDTATEMAECTYDLSHSWQAEHASWNGGKMDGFVSTHTSADYEGDLGTQTMGYYENTDIPFYWDLAQRFTICDNYFCSMLGPTHPNRMMQMTGSIDPAGVAGGPILVTSSDNALEFTCSWKTMPELLTENGIPWKVYNPFGTAYIPGSDIAMEICKNPLMYFAQYEDPSSGLYQRAFNYYGPNVKGGFTEGNGPNDFLGDIKLGTLPAVSWIVPPVGFDEHPPAPPALGEWYSSQVIKALLSNPEVWASTVLFIMYDENDGFFDHVPPPVAPAGTAGEYLTVDPLPADAGGIAGPIGMGVRVPMLVVSPFSVSSLGARTGKSGWVCSETFDHTSQLKFIESIFLPPGTIMGTGGLEMSQWRYNTVGDLTNALPVIKAPVTKKPKLAATSENVKKPPIGTECLADQLDELNPPTPVYPIPSPQVMPTQGPQTFTPTPHH